MTDTQPVPRARTPWRRVARPFFAVTVTAVILLLGTGGAALVAPSNDGEGPQFYSGVAVDVVGTVDGDVYAAGQSVTVSGDVTGDIIAAAQTITISGTVDGNIRLAGQAVTISGEVTRSATVFAQTLRIDEGALIDADVVGATGATSVSGDVGRDVYVSTERLQVDGSIGGDLTYISGEEASVADGAMAGSADVLGALAPRQFLDALAVQVDGPSAWELDLAIRWLFPDHGEMYRATLRNGVFTAVRDGRGECAVTISVPRAALAPLAAGDVAGARRAGVSVTGDVALLVKLFGVLDRGDPDFSIVVP